jgi:hypothetical protein
LVPIAIEHQLIPFFRGRHLNCSFPCFWSYIHHCTSRKSSITRNQGPAAYEEHQTSYPVQPMTSP